MTGIVVVSHSKLLAEGILELANQMTQGKVNLAIAAGVDDPDHPIGTDAVAIMTAIDEVFDEQGVVILMDLGSALLSAEMALELLEDDIRNKVVLLAAPIVEGTMAACVAAAAGLPIDAVIAEARTALDAKYEHLGEETQTTNLNVENTPLESDEALTFEWQVQNPNGIHARPAAAIVGKLAKFSCELWLEKDHKKVNAKSLNNIAKLSVRLGDKITFSACGLDSKEDISTFAQLAEAHFGEADLVNNTVQKEHAIDEEEKVVRAPLDNALQGISVSEGVAIGPAVLFAYDLPEVPERSFESIEAEKERIANAIQSTQQALKMQALQYGDIFNAHLMMLSDPEWWDKIVRYIEQGAIAEQAWMSSVNDLIDEYSQIENEYLKERTADILDIARQVMASMTGKTQGALSIDEPSILFAKDLLPSDVAALDKAKILAICLSEGGKTSHSAILAKAMGIPAVVKVQGCLDVVSSVQTVILDGFNGLLLLNPSVEQQQTMQQKREEWLEQKQQNLQKANEKAATKDGTFVDVLANIAGPEDVENALQNGAEGVGLFRTEFLFQAREELPTEDEQYSVYKAIAAKFGNQPITIRSLDIGGDKPLLSYPMPKEENPFLGLRGVRLCLKHEALFLAQLRAILRAHQEQNNIQLMIPMISTVNEVLQVKTLIEQEAKKLGIQKNTLALGIMIEVPAAVLNADALAKEVDFFSIGTNDLTQYILAADRGNTEVAELVDYFDPAVVRAIQITCAAADKAQIPVSMCGEMAGDPKATERLLTFGLRKFSASSSLLPALKANIRSITL